MKKEKPSIFVPRILWVKAFALLFAYRKEMPVTEVMVFSSALYGETEYCRCPRCHMTMEREYAAFCDRCGQRLGWKNYENARRIYPGQDIAGDVNGPALRIDASTKGRC